MAEDFPEKMARGLRREEWLNDHPPFASAFFFDEEEREDGKREMSVVDLSYKDALQHMMAQEYRGSKLFLAGYAVLTGDKLRYMVTHYRYPLEYEHRPSRNNPAHGNILIGKSTEFEERKIAARLAMSAELHSKEDLGGTCNLV